MKKSELIGILNKIGIPAIYYNIDGKGKRDQKMCIEYYNDKWNVFYSERGIKFDEVSFDNEEQAYDELLKRLVE